MAHRFFDQWAFVRRGRLDTDGDRNTVATADRRDVGPFPALARTDSQAPFFAAAKVASMKASSRFNRPSPCSRSASFFNPSPATPPAPLLKAPMAGPVGGYLLGICRHCAPCLESTTPRSEPPAYRRADALFHRAVASAPESATTSPAAHRSLPSVLSSRWFLHQIARTPLSPLAPSCHPLSYAILPPEPFLRQVLQALQLGIEERGHPDEVDKPERLLRFGRDLGVAEAVR